MLPKMVQQVFDEYNNRQHTQNSKRFITEAQTYQNLKLELELQLPEEDAKSEHQECLRLNRVVRYQVMATIVIVGLLQAIYFTYLLT